MSLIDLFSKKKTCSLLVNVDGRIVEKYQYFKDFLTHNRDVLNVIAELEQTYYGGSSFSTAAVKRRYDDLLEATRKLSEALNGIAKGKYGGLSGVCDQINEEASLICNPSLSAPAGDLVLPFEVLSPDRVKLAGAKATNLATVHNALGLPIPPGFALTVHAFERFLEGSGLAKPIEELLAGITTDMTPEMEARCKAIQEMVLKADVPPSIADAIRKAYEALEAPSPRRARSLMPFSRSKSGRWPEVLTGRAAWCSA
jgi:pyruvate, water dikinase